jgi:polysaccharide export outer membrane protein
MFKAVVAVALPMLWALSAAGADETPKELIQYVQDAKKLGLKDNDIKQSLVKAGWQLAAVEEAVTYVRALNKQPLRGTKKTTMPEVAPPQGGPGPATSSPTPKELIQYIQDAKKLGLEDNDIKQNAVKAGWQLAAVEEAVAYVHALNKQPLEGAEKTTMLVAAPPQGGPGPAMSSPNVPRDHGVPEGYQIGAGDVLQIMVWKEPDASVPSVVVRPDGKITMPLLKAVDVMGLTPTQAERMITERLSKFIEDVSVAVVVTGINSKKVYVVGAVRREGPIALQYRMSVLQALSEAGGLTDYAKRNKIYVLRTENGKQFRFPFNYNAVIKGEQMEQNIWVQPDDTIIVPH